MNASPNKRPDGAHGISLYFLNLRISGDWRVEIAWPYESDAGELSRGQGQLFGVKSSSDAGAILDEFQTMASALMVLDPTTGPASASERVVLLKQLTERARPTIEGFVLDSDSGRLEFQWGTANQSFREMLYTTLALALHEAPFWPLAQCEACRTFFLKPTNRAIKYCRDQCRRRLEVARYRERKRIREAPAKDGPRPKGRPGRTSSMGSDRKTSS